MPAYRFCRPDDIPLLVSAVNECYGVHFPDEEPLTVPRFREEMKEWSLWPSNCMLAMAGDEPVSVIMGTKRDTEVLILRVGTKPGHERNEYCLHMLTSLSQKLAVLGPPRLIVEAPQHLPGVPELFRAASYTEEREYFDYERSPGPSEDVPEGLIIPIGVDDLLDQDLLPDGDDLAWERRGESLIACKKLLEGVAIATPERVEAFFLFREYPQRVDVLAAGCQDPAQAPIFYTLLLRSLCARFDKTLRLHKFDPEEIAPGILAQAGFARTVRYVRSGAVATPG